MKSVVSLAALATLASAKGCGLKKFENLVTFGDSYTDEGRLGYYFGGNGAPPAGQLLPESSSTASGGYVWPRIISKNTGAKSFNYAVSGATVADDIVVRYLEGIHQNFPSVLDYEVPAFEADRAFPELYGTVYSNNTVYALWIGTNDLGGDRAFLTDRQVPGATLDDFVARTWTVFDRVYAAGGRHFVLLNTAPLELSPLYQVPEEGGLVNSQFWGDKSDYDAAEMKARMLEYTTTVNNAWKTGVAQFQSKKKRWPGASFSIFDVNTLIRDIIATPDAYLDAPANATGYYRHCEVSGGNCVDSSEPRASFLWYDELHPSERADEIIAKEFVKVINGDSKYGSLFLSR
ncbi:related to GDSL lipase/acylhydrolase family protein [Cephalotrichum gorgonifer]|uniref:Related to GDSL lipase/acylhydrolase family protein n=1 Tax=Cephalotrichum gorgonifer TaxID=2041049 RepID=A0AAE8SRU2_9PEZI|nr:related to GDSL lipase/acylhydrolase family protein [Cephalotrichum gorgonifer]